MLGDWGLDVTKFMTHLMIWIGVLWIIFSNKKNGREVRDKYNLNVDNPKWNQKTLGYKSLKALGPKILNNLPYHVKSSKNLDNFKNLLKNSDGNSCKYNLCKKNDIY